MLFQGYKERSSLLWPAVVVLPLKNFNQNRKWEVWAKLQETQENFKKKKVYFFIFSVATFLKYLHFLLLFSMWYQIFFNIRIEKYWNIVILKWMNKINSGLHENDVWWCFNMRYFWNVTSTLLRSTSWKQFE